MHDELFRQLDPPPGGLQKLRRRLEASGKRQRRRHIQLAVAFAVLLIVAVVGLVWNLSGPDPHTPAPPQARAVLPQSSHPGLQQLGLQPTTNLETAVVAPRVQSEQALSRVPTSNPNVVIYLHTSTRPRP